MNRNHICFVVLALTCAFGPNLFADDSAQSSTESRLREALRNTMLQLRDAQAQVITLQAAQAESDKEKADLSAKIDALNGQIKTLTDQAASDKAASEKTVADLKQSNTDLVTHMVDALSTRINSLNKQSPDDKAVLDKALATMKSPNPDLARQLDQYDTDIELWTTGYNQYVQFANKTEAERAKLAVQVIMLQRVVEDRERKNLTLFTTGNEILDRYEKFSLGDALSAKEPFVGITRVKLQEFVQDYKDKLTAQKISIGQAPSVAVQQPGSPSKNSIPPAQTSKP
jgi:chromosome segregation ATPase